MEFLRRATRFMYGKLLKGIGIDYTKGGGLRYYGVWGIQFYEQILSVQDIHLGCV